MHIVQKKEGRLNVKVPNFSESPKNISCFKKKKEAHKLKLKRGLKAQRFLYERF